MSIRTVLNCRTGVVHAKHATFHEELTACGHSYRDFPEFLEKWDPRRKVTCHTCAKSINPSSPEPKGIMNILTASVDNIMDNIKTFVLHSPECDHMITNRLEPTYRCRHNANTVGTCEWVFCPLRREAK